MHLALFLLFSVASIVNASEKTFSIMTYNAENLFDTKHDENKNDYPTLPIELKKGIYKKETEKACLFRGPVGSAGFFECVNTDWNDAVFDKKLSNIAKAIAMYNDGKGADAVVMEEVENQNVMNSLLEKLKPLGFRYTKLMEDKDDRGIDVGIITKYPITSYELHSADAGTAVKRGIYQYNINLNGVKLTILGNHWPSQHNPVNDRLVASDLLKSVADRIDADIVVSVGDFNTPESETPNAVHAIYDEHTDARTEALKMGTKIFPGTYKYKGKWDILDRFLVRIADIKKGKIKPLYNSFQIINNSELIKGTQSPSDPINGAPVRFDPKSGMGFSDHLPVAMKFQVAM